MWGWKKTSWADLGERITGPWCHAMVSLSKAFILACLHIIDSGGVDVLMTSFLNYRPPGERSAVETILWGTVEESDEEDLLDLSNQNGLPFPISREQHGACHTNNVTWGLSERAKVCSWLLLHTHALIQQKQSNKERVLPLCESKKATGVPNVWNNKGGVTSERTVSL